MNYWQPEMLTVCTGFSRKKNMLSSMTDHFWVAETAAVYGSTVKELDCKGGQCTAFLTSDLY